MALISKELQDTVVNNPNIENVYFDRSGNHYFNPKKLLVKRGGKEESLFGQGKVSHRQRIDEKTNYYDITEEICVGVLGTEISETVPRETIINSQAVNKDDTVYNAISGMSVDQIAKLKALLGMQSETTVATTTQAAPQADDFN